MLDIELREACSTHINSPSYSVSPSPPLLSDQHSTPGPLHLGMVGDISTDTLMYWLQSLPTDTLSSHTHTAASDHDAGLANANCTGMSSTALVNSPTETDQLRQWLLGATEHDPASPTVGVDLKHPAETGPISAFDALPTWHSGTVCPSLLHPVWPTTIPDHSSLMPTTLDASCTLAASLPMATSESPTPQPPVEEHTALSTSLGSLHNPASIAQRRHPSSVDESHDTLMTDPSLSLSTLSAASKPKSRGGGRHQHTTFVTSTLRAWLCSHSQRPYPTPEEKEALCRITGLDITQLNDWFVNARRRALPKILKSQQHQQQQQQTFQPHLTFAYSNGTHQMGHASFAAVPAMTGHSSTQSPSNGWSSDSSETGGWPVGPYTSSTVVNSPGDSLVLPPGHTSTNNLTPYQAAAIAAATYPWWTANVLGHGASVEPPIAAIDTALLLGSASPSSTVPSELTFNESQHA